VTRGRAIVLGTLTVGVLDALDAIVFFGLRSGATPVRIFQSIASGLLGRAAFSGGLAAACLGVALHFFIAFAIVTTYHVLSRRWTWLTRRPLIYGAIYGVIVYAIMTFIVVPLSAAGGGVPAPAVAANGLLIHIAGVGIPSALFARAAQRHA